MEYQYNEYITHAIMVPKELAKKLKILPGVMISRDQVHELRESLGIYRGWPLQTPRVSNKWLDNEDK